MHRTTDSPLRIVPIFRTAFAMAATGLLTCSLVSREAPAQVAPPAANKTSDETPADEVTQRLAEFGKQLSGSIWQGHFTVDGQQDGLKEERYEVQSVSKLPGVDTWLFTGAHSLRRSRCECPPAAVGSMGGKNARDRGRSADDSGTRYIRRPRGHRGPTVRGNLAAWRCGRPPVR